MQRREFLSAQLKSLLANMALDEKLGQMTQAELNNLKDERDTERLFLGSVLGGGDADPKEGPPPTAR